VPLNVDSERLFAEDLDGVAESVRLLHAAGASGCSIEDWNSDAAAIDPIGLATERVAAAAAAAHVDGDPLLLTARCENLLRGVMDLDDTIARLCAYRDAGADCVYAPGLSTTDQIRAVVDAVGIPVNVLHWPGGPTVAEIGEAGGRRVSIGSSLASTAYGALMVGARELLTSGTIEYLATRLQPEDRAALR
jgi:2-methylisocitrate lyase-like PEP mutase family enzyme